MKKTSLLAILATVLLTGCQQTEDFENTNEKLPIQIEASIGSSITISGRYAGEEPNIISFAQNDNIGLFVNGENHSKWTYNGSRWEQNGSTINWTDKTSNHNFQAFYPYTESATITSIPMPDLSEQDGTMNIVASKDFLVATKTQNYGIDGTVSFTDKNSFTHVSSLLSITIKGQEDLASATIENIQIKGDNIATPSTYTFETETSVNLSDNKAEQINELAATVSRNMNGEDQTFYFVVNSETVKLANVELIVEYSFTDGDNKDLYKANIIGLNKNENSNEKFDKGKQYCYTLKIQDRTLIISGNSITNWEDGETIGEIVVNGSKQEQTNNENS